MAKQEKLRCDTCRKEELEDNTTDWIKNLIPEKDFCSKKCAAKFVKKEYNEVLSEEDNKEEIELETKIDNPVTTKTKKSNTIAEQNDWELKSVTSQYSQVIHNKETDEMLDTLQALVTILNKLDQLDRRL